MAFSTTVWEWYGQDEYKRILAVCEAIPGLAFLAMGADEQRNTIPYCPACEAWSGKMLPLDDVLTICGTAMPDDVRAGVRSVWDLCNSLPETAFHCNDWWIFDQHEWQPIREAAEQALNLIEAEKLSPYLDELTLDCRNAVRGLKR